MTQQEISRLFRERTGFGADLVVRAPGRINIIGEHTDYNDGFVMPGAIDRSLLFAARLNGTRQLRLWAEDIQQQATVDLDHLTPGDELWVNYLAGIAQQFQQREFQTPGLDVVFGGNLPVGAGVSSSAALECGMATVWNTVLQAGLNGPELAKLAQSSSHQFVGIPCGIMDQFASLMGQQDAVIVLDCRSLAYETIPADVVGYTWVLLNSKAAHELASSEYPIRVAECQEGLQIIQQKHPAIDSLREATSHQVRELEGEMPVNVFNRCLYVTGENERVMEMKEALADGNAKAVGALLNTTHAGLRDLYEVSCPEIEVLIEEATKHEGVLGARIMGGGFGGCTLNLVAEDQCETFVQRALENYHAATGITGEFLEVSLRGGVEVLS